jgi:UDP-N-acetylglucosamine 2-epimerase (non-hydrolysing)
MEPYCKLLLIAGARPNFMKIAPLIHCVQRHNAQRGPNKPAVKCVLVHTGQHYDAQMSEVFFRELGIPTPDVSLEVGSGSHAVQTASIMMRFEPVCEREQADWVVVVGDVNSTLACTLVAAKLGTRVAHVEAGLRSYDRTMPEEINRIVTDSIADLLLTPSDDASETLRREGIGEHKIRAVGNIMIDSVIAHLRSPLNGSILKQVGVTSRQFIYVTLHRPANVDSREALSIIVKELAAIAEKCPVVFPIHPRTRRRMEEFGLSLGEVNGLKLLDPVGYHDSLSLTEHARCVLTDSGGLQEESTFFRTPCLTLRPNTERPVTITVGSNRLTSIERLHADIEGALAGPDRIGRVPLLWDGKTAERILHALLDFPPGLQSRVGSAAS